MKKNHSLNKWRQSYIYFIVLFFFILFARALYLLCCFPDYEIMGSQYIFFAKPGLISMLWSIVILCVMMMPLSIHHQIESTIKRERILSRAFQYLILLMILGIMSSSIYGINLLKQIRIIVDKDFISYSSVDGSVSVSWDFETISAYNAPWYFTGGYTDEYAWINLCGPEYSLHLPLSYVGGTEKLIEQSYQYWKEYNSRNS